MKQDRPLLSIGMIVKNEMRCLKNCLDALTPLREAVPCELVIADTGSTDGTRELAAEYADILFDFVWCNDFSAARNAVLDKCSGAWHLQVDADEYLDGDFSELTAFLTSDSVDKFEMGVVAQRNYGSEGMREDDYTDFHARRMLRMDTGSRYKGTIHETPEIKDGYKVVRLSRVVLHHDGYVGEQGKGKKERNLPLLEKELENNPGVLHRVVQCLESSNTLEKIRKYAPMAVETAEKADDKDFSLHYWRIAAFHDAVSATAVYSFPELPAWAERARELFPHSVLVGVGVSYGYASYLAKLGEYERACGELDIYFNAIDRFNSGDYDAVEFQISSTSALSKKSQKTARLLQVLCLGKLERWQELADALDCLDLAGKQDDALQLNYLNGLLKLWQNYEPSAERILKRMLDSLEGKERREEREAFIKLCGNAFVKPKDEQDEHAMLFLREDWRLFATLGDGCDLGRFGLLMAANDSAEAESLLSAIERLDLVPPEALEHALALGAALPERFFRMKAEDISGLAAGLARLLPDEPERAIKLCVLPEEKDPGKALFSYTVACELAGGLDWEKHGSLALFEYFCDRAEEYIPLFYSPVMCTTDNMHALPILTRFAMCCVQARKSWRSGDEMGFVRGLRAGLATCPGMKKMVSYLTDKAKAMLDKPKPTPELMALADQIRAILAQYPADDPAVQLLKNSEEYKLVAHLIEG